jgi:hypothetical protein
LEPFIERCTSIRGYEHAKVAVVVHHTIGSYIVHSSKAWRLAGSVAWLPNCVKVAVVVYHTIVPLQLFGRWISTYTACFSTFATSLGHSKPLELLFRHFDGVE